MYSTFLTSLIRLLALPRSLPLSHTHTQTHACCLPFSLSFSLTHTHTHALTQTCLPYSLFLLGCSDAAAKYLKVLWHTHTHTHTHSSESLHLGPAHTGVVRALPRGEVVRALPKGEVVRALPRGEVVRALPRGELVWALYSFRVTGIVMEL